MKSTEQKKQYTELELAAAAMFGHYSEKIESVLQLIIECNDIGRALQAMGYGVAVSDGNPLRDGRNPIPTLELIAKGMGCFTVDDVEWVSELFEQGLRPQKSLRVRRKAKLLAVPSPKPVVPHET